MVSLLKTGRTLRRLSNGWTRVMCQAMICTRRTRIRFEERSKAWGEREREGMERWIYPPNKQTQSAQTHRWIKRHQSVAIPTFRSINRSIDPTEITINDLTLLQHQKKNSRYQKKSASKKMRRGGRRNQVDPPAMFFSKDSCKGGLPT